MSFIALIQSRTFSRRHTKTHADSNICHSERHWLRSTTTQLWNADMSSSNHTKDFVQCCHGKQMVASSRTLLSDHVCATCCNIQKLCILSHSLFMFCIILTVNGNWHLVCTSNYDNTRSFKYDWDWFVCKQAVLRSSCATLREWSHNLHPPSCSG